MSVKDNISTISISKQFFFKFILFILIGLLLVYIRYLLLTLAIAFIMASFTKYFAQSLEKRYRIRYKYGLTTIFICILVSIVIFFLQLFPLMIKEGYSLFELISVNIQSFENNLSLIGVPIDSIQITQFTSLIPNLGEATFGILGLLGQIITYILLIFVLAFYISINETGVNKIVQVFVPNEIKDNVPSIIKNLEYHIGKWAFMEFSLALIIGMFVYTIVFILGLKYNFILASLAGLSQLVPFIGPFLIMSIIVIFAFVQNIYFGFIMVISIIFIQLIKQYLLIPVIFNYNKSINSLVIVLSLMIGGVLAGVLGVIIAMPIVSLAKIIYKDIVFYAK